MQQNRLSQTLELFTSEAEDVRCQKIVKIMSDADEVRGLEKNPLIGSYRSAVCKILKLSTFFSSHKILSIKNVLNELINALIDTLT